ncbi:proline-rich protein 14 isoform X2 [Hemicordylus capensis]|uniref:proline-rich protein 14 isoform X2 n=1 Tax=Hemicordylus capensis TaxID=884348 RepID=UPI002303BD84|nr:proline-rich protein 14 isoform X2 [Hemicordylus capensis]
MERPLLEGLSEGDPQPVIAFQRHVRRRRILIYRPSLEEQESPTLSLKSLEQGRASPPPCGETSQSSSKRQRLQQGSPPIAEKSSNGGYGRAGETLWHMASPMEKKQRKVLAVDLEDFSTTQESPQGCSPLQRPAMSPSKNPLQLTYTNEEGTSWSAKGQSSFVGRSSPPKGGSPPCQEPQEKLAHACRQLWGHRLPPPNCCESERLQAKRQRLQKGAPLANGNEVTKVSPLEKARRQILAISLDDSLNRALEADVGKEKLETSPSPCGSDQLVLPCQSPAPNVERPTPSGQRELCHPTDASSEVAEPPSSWPPSASTLLRPSVAPCFRPWGLVPVFQTMRSKLEAFADIFLSPSKPSLPSTEGTPTLLPRPQANEDQAAAQPGTPRQGVNIEVKIAISEPRPRKRSCHHEEEETGSVVVSGRPPIRQWRLNEGDPAPQPRLGRSYSCPDFPGACSWRASPTALPHSAQLRQRRHTVCSLEVSRELGRPTPPCLRKEVYPFCTSPARLLLGPSVHAPHCDGSSYSSPVPSCCLESNPAHSRDISPSPEGGQRVPGVGLDMDDSKILASEQMMLSEAEMKDSQDNTIGKVSCIRIRRTPARQQANLTPMGLPRPVRSFETIFEVPLERNGALIFTSQRKLKRAMEFREGGLPRKQRKARSRGRRWAGGRRAQPQPPELEELLQQRLAELDALFEEEEY